MRARPRALHRWSGEERGKRGRVGTEETGEREKAELVVSGIARRVLLKAAGKPRWWSVEVCGEKGWAYSGIVLRRIFRWTNIVLMINEYAGYRVEVVLYCEKGFFRLINTRLFYWIRRWRSLNFAVWKRCNAKTLLQPTIINLAFDKYTYL